MYEYDLIGLGSPVHDHVEPLNVKNFINDMRFVGGKHAFCFCTHGTHGDFFTPSVTPQFKSKGLIHIGDYDCYAPCYLPEMPVPYLTAGHPDKIDLKEAEAEGIFRRLVREEDIDWDIPIYMKYDKHPQWVIGKGLVK